MQKHTLIAIALFALPGLSLSLPAPVQAHATIQWRTCETDLVGDIPAALGSRLACGTFEAPLDHAAPDGRTITVGVVRVRAADPAQRQGAIFFNRGGPGANPARLLRSLGAGWSGADPHDPDTADKYRLPQRYDLIAVIPRGLKGGHEYLCVTGLPPTRAFLPTHLDDDNWQRVLDDAQAEATACTAPLEARYINTEQHVHDMDMVRRALGDDLLHFYGISYGGKVGAWYAAMYPGHVGRMLMDSPMAFTHDFRGATEMMRKARRSSFSEALESVKANPSQYGLTGNSADIVASIETLPDRAREAWHDMLDTSPRIAAAVWFTEWLGENTPPSRMRMEGRIRRQTFSADRSKDSEIRWAAMQLTDRYFSPPRTEAHFDMGQDGDSVRLAVICNDMEWNRSDAELHALAIQRSRTDLPSDGEEIVEEALCARWGGRSAREPNLHLISKAPTFLILQSEKDLATPWEGARYIHQHFDNSVLLLARGSELHGIYNFTLSPCIERTVSRYLLDGALPASDSRELHCEGNMENPLSALPHTTTPTPPVEEPHRAPHDEN